MVQFSENLLKNRQKFDLVVFDVDGVLLDTRTSFPNAIIKAVLRYWKINRLVKNPQPTIAEVSAFRTIPGFNNDWDLAEAYLVFYLQQEFCKQPVQLADFLEKLDRLGGGITGLRRWIDLQDERKQIKEKYQLQVIRQLSMEYYAGEEYCQFLYHFEPQFGIQKGTIHKERVLINTDYLSKLTLRKGIYTGRNKPETQLALKHIGYPDWQMECVMFDDGKTPVKPDAEPLGQIVNRLNSKRLIFAGDSHDDYSASLNFRQNYPQVPIEFVQVLADRDAFDSNGSFVENVNQLLTFLISGEISK